MLLKMKTIEIQVVDIWNDKKRSDVKNAIENSKYYATLILKEIECTFV